MPDVVPAADEDQLERMRALLVRAPLIDGHNDMLWELREQVGYDFDRIDISRDCPSLQTDLPRLRRGGVGAQFWSVWVPSHVPAADAVVGTLEQLDAFHRMLARYPERVALALTADDIEEIASTGRIASLAGMEGGHSIGGSLGALRMMHALGARYLTLTHNDNTSWADAAMDIPEHGGLTDLGVAVVAELNRLGMLVDLSHVAPTTMRDALAATVAPVVFSHSSARAICDHPRNVPDDVLAALPGNGGVAMVTFVPGFINPRIAEIWLAGDQYERDLRGQFPDDPDEVTRRVAQWQQDHPTPVATVAMVADHVDHFRDVAGIGHIGIGSDYDGVAVQPDGMPDVSSYPVLFAELAGRGYSDADLRAVAGGNILRVLRAAEAVAAGN